ncbi:MAG: sensor histidine kinase [Paracoccaceae bacterium]
MIESRRDPFGPRTIAVGAIAGLIAMGLLAFVVTDQFRAVQLRDARDIGSAYVQGFLAPYAQEAHDNGQLSAVSRRTLMRLVGNLASARQFDAIRIRAPDRAVLFASDSTTAAITEDPAEFYTALKGEAVAEIHYPEARDDLSAHPKVEIYAPIYNETTNKLIAVGEIYQDARQLLAERAQFERRVWGAVSLATVGFLAMMSMIARQNRLLIGNLKHQREIAAQNNQLREAAETAWRSSSQSNEALLNQLGAELHDGPVQMLSLLALTAAPGPISGAAGEQSAQGIAQGVLADLRRISAGLTLPELGQLSVAETLMLAITRHANATASEVSHELGPLPDAIDDQRKTCIYRIVQEGLNNALRHGGGNGQRVTATVEGDSLRITVADSGRTEAENDDRNVNHIGLGVTGLRNRLAVFGGTLETHRPPEGGFVLATKLPLS